MKKLFLIFLASILFFSQAHGQSNTKPMDPVFEVFDKHVRPYLMKGYKVYYDNVGEKIGSGILWTYDSTAPTIAHVYKNNVEFWYAMYPEFFDDFSRVPTPLKIAHEKFLFALWGALQKFKTDDVTKVNSKFTTATNMIFAANLVRTGKVKASKSDQKRLEKLLNDLRYFTPDKELRNCLRVYAVPSDIINAFNTGCNIFVNSGLYKNLNDDQLRAVIAHEVSHGSNGDGLKTFSHIFTSVVSHLFKVNMEGLTWILTDVEMEYLKETFERGTGEMIIQGVGSRAPVLEIIADQNGARLLNASGYSAIPSIEALTVLKKISEEYQKKNPRPPQKGVRKYPGLEERSNAIKSVMEF